MRNFGSSFFLLLLLCASAALGFFVNARLPEKHKSRDSIELVQLAITLLVTFTAIVLRLLTTSVKSGFDAAYNARGAYAGQLAQIDRCLRDYGAETQPMRDELRAYVAAVIAAWATRYLDPVISEQAVDLGEAPRNVVVRETRNSKFQQTVAIGPHRMLADEPIAAGGEDTGPGPYDFVLAGLGACTSMTMRLYADRKSLPLERVTVTLKHSKIHAEDCAECETKVGMLDQIERVIAMDGNLDTEQRKKLMEIADKCPVHRTLTSEVHIVTHPAD